MHEIRHRSGRTSRAYLALGLAAYVAAFFSKAAAISVPATLVAIDFALDPYDAELAGRESHGVGGGSGGDGGGGGGKSDAGTPATNATSPFPSIPWRAAVKAPFVVFALGMVYRTTLANEHGASRDSDVVALDLPQRAHKALLTMSMYVLTNGQAQAQA